LRRAADVAADLGLTIGVEAYRKTSGSMVLGVQGMVDLADEIDRPNVGIIVDTWHLWDDPGVLDDVRRHVSRIVGVQICDYRNPTRSWADRVLPGDGVIDWAAWFRTLDQAGYEGWYDLEIFSDNGVFGNVWPDSIWSRPGREVAQDAMAGFASLWASRNAGGDSGSAR
jgi:sugar phosphate isomerase/epimerase